MPIHERFRFPSQLHFQKSASDLILRPSISIVKYALLAFLGAIEIGFLTTSILLHYPFLRFITFVLPPIIAMGAMLYSKKSIIILSSALFLGEAVFQFTRIIIFLIDLNSSSHESTQKPTDHASPSSLRFGIGLGILVHILCIITAMSLFYYRRLIMIQVDGDDWFNGKSAKQSAVSFEPSLPIDHQHFNSTEYQKDLKLVPV